MWALWLLLTVAVIDGVVWTLSGGTFLMNSDARLLVLALALVFGGVMARCDDAPLDSYGLGFSDQWVRHALFAFVIAAVFVSGYWMVAWRVGAVTYVGDRVDLLHLFAPLYRFFIVLLVASITIVLTVGLLLGLLLRSWPWPAAVMGAAAAFALLYATDALDGPDEWFGADGAYVLSGAVVVGIVLCLLRLATGSIVVPLAALCGLVLVSDSQAALRLFDVVRDAPAARAWWMPVRDEPVGSPALWLSLALPAAAAAARVAMRGPAEPPSGALPDPIRRVYPMMMFNIGAPLDVWWGELKRANFDIPAVYWPRLAMVFAISLLTTLLYLPERLILSWLLRKRTPPPPVFIVGMHRSGTTHLHNLVSLDPSLQPARTYQVLNPHAFLFTGWLLALPLAAFMPWRRPMDAMNLSAFSPQEDEFALANACGMSPYWGWTFTEAADHYDRYLCVDNLSPAELSQWKRAYVRFVNALTLLNRKRPILKTPFNAARIGVLRELFPGARFIHIHRHPYDVVRSCRHMHNTLLPLFELQEPPDEQADVKRIIDNYREIEAKLQADAANMPCNELATVAFEKLEEVPVAELRRVFAQLELPWTDAFEQRLLDALDQIAGYPNGKHKPLPPDIRRQLNEQLAPLFERFGYEMDAG